jgi:hypothetical protein
MHWMVRTIECSHSDLLTAFATLSFTSVDGECIVQTYNYLSINRLRLQVTAGLNVTPVSCLLEVSF